MNVQVQACNCVRINLATLKDHDCMTRLECKVVFFFSQNQYTGRPNKQSSIL